VQAVHKVVRRGRQLPRGILALMDASMWLLATLAATGLRYMEAGATTPWAAAFMLGVGLAFLHVMVAWIMRLYSGRHRVGSADETVLLGLIVVFTACVGTLAIEVPWPARTIAISIPFLAGALAGASILGSCLAIRTLTEYSVRPTNGSRAVIVGAGDAGTSLVGDLLTNPAKPYLPSAFVDDDPNRSTTAWARSASRATFPTSPK
jgi:FlaA1/EpsC-like NDP-sugar epimerase